MNSPTPTIEERLLKLEQRLDTFLARYEGAPAISRRAPRQDVDAFDVVLHLVAERFDLTPRRLMLRERTEEIAWPRQVCMWLLRRHTDWSLNSIGKRFGKDHGTICHGCDRVNERREAEPDVQAMLTALEEKVKGALLQ